MLSSNLQVLFGEVERITGMETKKATQMQKRRMLIAVDSLITGGIAKSLAAFVSYCKETCDIDVLVWRSSLPEEVSLPDGVNRIFLPGTESVRTVFKSRGVFSRDFPVSLCGALRKKRWLAVPRIRKEYDIAIAYSHVSNVKYYVIDRVRAKRKYTFYHHGAYTFPESMKRLDAEYYPRYDRVFAVSETARTVLREAFPTLEKVSVLPNLVDIEGIRQSAKAPCPEYPDGCGIRLLTVGRLSPEKEPLRIVEAAKLLDAEGIQYRWIVAGDGELAGTMKEEIRRNRLDDKVIPVGNQKNPYRFMSRCDCYVQFSRFEADSLTVKEAAVFNKSMVLSDILQFRSSRKVYNNILLYGASDNFKDVLLEAVSRMPVKNDLKNFNEEACGKIDSMILHSTDKEPVCSME